MRPQLEIRTNCAIAVRVIPALLRVGTPLFSVQRDVYQREVGVVLGGIETNKVKLGRAQRLNS
jgi:hypothetical protein